MADPLSVAASVAGLVALVGTVSKSGFQFFSSIKDAPDNAKNLVRSLYTLNVALGQIQQNLLDPDFVSETNDKDVEDLQQCLASCTAVFTQLQTKIEDCGLGTQGQHLPRKTWESIKWSFTDDALKDILRRVEAEKATLQLHELLISAFTAKVTTGLLRYAKQTEARTRHMSRQLKDITITLQWLLPRVPDYEQRIQSIANDDHRAIESSVFAASSAYNAGELVNLLRSSGSSLSLALDTSNNDTASVLWQPETERTLEPRASFSRVLRGPPPQDHFGNLRRTDSLMSSRATSGMVQVQKTRRSWLRKAPSLAFDPLTISASVMGMIQMSSVMYSYLADIKKAGKGTSQLQSDIEEIMARVTSFSGLLDTITVDEPGEAPPGLLEAWNLTERSVREYYDFINRALDRARKGAVLSVLINNTQESEREALRQIAIRNIETVHMLTHTSFMERTMRSQRNHGKQLGAIMDHMSEQFEWLGADLGHLTRSSSILTKSSVQEEADKLLEARPDEDHGTPTTIEGATMTEAGAEP